MKIHIIEAKNLNEAEQKANKVKPRWEDIRFQNPSNVQEVLQGL